MFTTYTGKLVRIRPFRDESELRAFCAAQFRTLNEHFGDCRWRIDDAVERFRFNLLGGLETCFAIEQSGSGEPVGWVNARPQRDQLAGSIGTEILTEHRSQGYGREAKLLALCHMFENFPLQSVWAVTLGKHQRSARGLEAIGMQCRGSKNVSEYSQAGYASRLYYQIMREDWEKLPVRQTVRRG
ncbi:GNAT family N-acetyltransferase [bacterium]|nr:GNAT family N-acetyltransferase [bacterium]